MKHKQQDHLLRELTGGPQLEALRQTSLARGLLTLRRRRRRAMTIRAGAIAALAAVVISGGLRLRPRAPSTTEHEESPQIATISDDQLLNLFADRGAALVGLPGDQQLMFLDGGQEAIVRIR